ncbi:MAG: TIGR03663 family protein, partial [Chloroflexales bacterium]|nr:TIGR03663 family protein [Chloroflexales bacterium]
MATDTLQRPRPLLERSLDLSRVNGELLAYVLLFALSVVAHLWGLGVMGMHHDESVHAFPTWSLYMGRGGFTCANGASSPVYCYDPVYHGPTLYFFMLTSFFLFGDSELTARLPMAVAGILLVASAPLLRPYLGKRGALIAALLLAFAPSLLYYTRFARHDAFMLLWQLWMVIGFLRFVDTGRGRWLSLLAAGAALAVATHEMYYILAFIFGLFVIIRALDESRFSARLQLGLLIALGVCGALIVVNPPIPVGQGLFFGDKAMLLAACLILGLLIRRAWSPEPVLLPRLQALWRDDRTSLWVALAVFWGLYILFYSSFFAYPYGIIDGLYKGLSYWLGSQQAYARGDQPWYYYFML